MRKNETKISRKNGIFSEATGTRGGGNTTNQQQPQRLYRAWLRGLAKLADLPTHTKLAEAFSIPVGNAENYWQKDKLPPQLVHERICKGLRNRLPRDASLQKVMQVLEKADPEFIWAKKNITNIYDEGEEHISVHQLIESALHRFDYAHRRAAYDTIKMSKFVVGGCRWPIFAKGIEEHILAGGKPDDLPPTAVAVNFLGSQHITILYLRPSKISCNSSLYVVYFRGRVRLAELKQYAPGSKYNMITLCPGAASWGMEPQEHERLEEVPQNSVKFLYAADHVAEEKLYEISRDFYRDPYDEKKPSHKIVKGDIDFSAMGAAAKEDRDVISFLENAAGNFMENAGASPDDRAIASEASKVLRTFCSNLRAAKANRLPILLSPK